MSQLSAQSIKKLCQDTKWWGLWPQTPMIYPFTAEKVVVNGKSYGLSSASYDVRIAHDLRILPWEATLAYTIEDFYMPDNVVGYVCDKSTYARLFVSAFNTLFDPGFQGNATLELVNMGEDVIDIKAGDPICQLAFHWLDKKTDRPYSGKYQHQTKAAHGPRYEKLEQ